VRRCLVRAMYLSASAVV